jgi:hypothetical protein
MAHLSDSRSEPLKLANTYQEGWQTKEIHYNHFDHGCYLSLEGTEAATNPDGKRLYSTTQTVMDVNENRDVLRCSSARERGQVTEEWLCSGPDGQSITHERFLDLRKHYLERK